MTLKMDILPHTFKSNGTECDEFIILAYSLAVFLSLLAKLNTALETKGIVFCLNFASEML